MFVWHSLFLCSTHIDVVLSVRMYLVVCIQVIPQLQSTSAGHAFTGCVTVALTVAQYCGLEIVGATSIIVVVVTMMPFVVLICGGIGKMEWTRLTESKPAEDIQWALLLTNLFWNLNYWDSISTLANEVCSQIAPYARIDCLRVFVHVYVFVWYTFTYNVYVYICVVSRNVV